MIESSEKLLDITIKAINDVKKQTKDGEIPLKTVEAIAKKHGITTTRVIDFMGLEDYNIDYEKAKGFVKKERNTR